MPHDSDSWAAVLALSEEQWGLVTRQQVEATGTAWSTLSRKVRGGALERVAHGVYRVRGKKTPSPLMDKLSFGQFNAAFKPARTGYDWLSRDPAEVDKYVADPWCGQISSAGLFGDLLGGLAWVNDEKNLGRVPKTLPVYLFSGALDPVGANTVGVQKVADQYRRLGVQDVSVRFYDGARHETLNETNRDEVTADVVAWVTRVTSS